jgi:trehalose/maltose hydrolase-like predicted phosphorylase
MLQWAKLGAGAMAIGVAMAVWPAASASAGVEKSSICTAYKAEEAKQVKASTALTKDIESGNWATIQKAMLSTFASEAGAERQFDAYLNGASAKVKAAAAVALQLDASFKTVIEKSTSLTSFEAAITKAESTPKVTAALKVLDAYSGKLCPTSTPTT